jgi:acyl transferase domain-containing protein
MTEVAERAPGSPIAVVGMAGRFPGADDLEQFWRNLREGVESIARFTENNLCASGVSQESLSHLTCVRGGLSDIAGFDAQFFGYSPAEAEIMDPQQRLFWECAWAALENAGYNPEACRGSVGIFAASNPSTYAVRDLLTNPRTVQSVEPLKTKIGNDKGFLPTPVSAKINLRSPSLAVQSACSTSLVSVRLACQSLLNCQCDMAVAGGVSLVAPIHAGHVWERGIFSTDGSCRAFDSEANGTVGGEAVGAVVLKRLEDAIRDRDPIRAVILSSATNSSATNNNDGAAKVGYTAPSLNAQREVIAMAHAWAGIDPSTISYIEAHGTATPLCDVIELKALAEAFQMATPRTSFCALGSVNTNVGHLDIAAGIAGLIKTVLVLENGEVPPSLNSQRAAPEIDLAGTPFYVNTRLSRWPAALCPRRAGVGSFGIGDPNVYMVLEEAPKPEPSAVSYPAHLIVLSAGTPQALEKMTDGLAEQLVNHPEISLPDVAYTCQTGRKTFLERRCLVSRSKKDAITSLRERSPKSLYSGRAQHSRRRVAFLFPGLGNQYMNMGLGLYREVPVFRQTMDSCAEILRPLIGVDIIEMLYPKGIHAAPETATSGRLDLSRLVRGGHAGDPPNSLLNQTYVAQPTIFAVEYALSRLFFDWGVKPDCVVGHSLGEYVAACVAGVYSLEDALTLVALRAKLIQSKIPEGGMLAAAISEAETQALLLPGLSISAVNGEALTVVGGPKPLISDLEIELRSRGIACRVLAATHAFHSKMMEPIAQEFVSVAAKFRRNEPEIAILSNVTGKAVQRQEMNAPEY